MKSRALFQTKRYVFGVGALETELYYRPTGRIPFPVRIPLPWVWRKP